MDTLPREILDAVIQELADYEFPDSGRFPILDDASRQAILTARLVGRYFRDSKKLNELFVAVLEETPFMWQYDQMPRLVGVSRWKMANQMRTLTLCGMSLEPWYVEKISIPRSERHVSRASPRDLTSVLRRFIGVKHFRYYPVSPKCFHEAWPGRKSRFGLSPLAQRGYPPDDVVTHSWLIQQ